MFGGVIHSLHRKLILQFTYLKVVCSEKRDVTWKEIDKNAEHPIDMR